MSVPRHVISDDATQVAFSKKLGKVEIFGKGENPEIFRVTLDPAKNPVAGSLFNVNIPVLERGPIKGVKVLPQNVTPYAEQYDRRINPRGRTYFWSSPEFSCPSPHPDTDVTALEEGYITVTPLKFDMTDHMRMLEMQTWEWNRVY